jgi:hypothetical protein
MEAGALAGEQETPRVPGRRGVPAASDVGR